jgi:2'-5' RNA ligase
VCELPAQARHHRFRPHVTVARMRQGHAPRERTLAPTPALSFVPRELVLYRSWLSDQGASYEPVAGVPLA